MLIWVDDISPARHERRTPPIAAALTKPSGVSLDRTGDHEVPEAPPRWFAQFERIPPIYPVAIAICLGDALGNGRYFVPPWLALSFGVAAALAYLRSHRRAGYVLTLAAIVLTSILPIRDLLHPVPSTQTIRQLPEGAMTTIEGVLIEEPQHLNDRTRLMLQVLRAGTVESMTPMTGLVRVTILDRSNPLVGDEIAVTARLHFPRNYGNPGEYDYAGAMARDGIAATLTVAARDKDSDALRVLAHERHFPHSQLQDVRDRIAVLINQTLPHGEAGEMRALIVGDRSGIDDQLRDAFARTGMAHLLVISGLHLGFVAAAVFAAVRFLTMLAAPALASRGWANKIAAIGAAIAVCTYTAVAGHHVSTVRAMVMVLSYMLAIVLDRPREAIASLALAAIVICLMLPGSTADISFQLSFASVLAVLLGMERFAAWIKMRRRRGRLPAEADATGWRYAERPLGYIAVSFWATIGTAPLTAFHFNQVAFVGLIANAVVVPIMGFGATVAGLVAAILTFISEPAARWVFWLASYLLSISNWLAEWFLNWPFAWAHVFTPTSLEMVVGYALILIWLTAPRAKVPLLQAETAPDNKAGDGFGWRMIAVSALTILTVADAGWWLHDRYFCDDLRVTFLSVGEGDAAVVRFPGRRVMLIDAGGAYAGFDSGERVVAPYLWSQKILHVDYLVLSHPDNDHFGGFGFIASNFTPSELWAPTIPSSDTSYATMLIAMMQAHVRLKTLDTDAAMKIGNVAVHTTSLDSPTGPRHNNGSVVLKLDFGKTGYLFTGDIEAPAERSLIAAGADLRATVLKVPHHGSRTSSTAEFIEAVRPAVAVISDGYHNRFHFPARQVVDRYRDAGVKVLRTDLDGAVETRASPISIGVRTFRDGSFRISKEHD